MFSILLTSFFAFAQSDKQAQPETPITPLQSVQADAAALLNTVTSDFAMNFLASTADLPTIEGKRVVHWDRAAREALTPEEATNLSPTEMARFKTYELDEQFYYHTLYGTPVTYARLLDLVDKHGFQSPGGKHLLDFGYGNLAHLRMLASLGMHAVGVDIDELLAVFYRAPGDTGLIKRSSQLEAGTDGSLRIVSGQFPANPQVILDVGTGFDLIISKNVLKLGYIHPERTPNPAAQIELGVDDETFLNSMYTALNSGGLFAIYNLHPKQVAPEDGYLTWATGDCPWSRKQVLDAGFEVLAFNVNDDQAVREMAHQLGWHEEPQSMDLKNNLFAKFTILRKP